MNRLLHLIGAAVLAVGSSHAQTADTSPEAKAADGRAADLRAADLKEQTDLAQAMNEAGSSSIELIRALELHLKKYPDSKQRPALEKVLAKSAMELNDSARIILYGEKVLARETPPDMQSDIPPLIDRVIRALVEREDVAQARKALVYAKRYEEDVAAARIKVEPPGHLTAGQWSQELDKALARSLALQARATGYAGDPAAAEKIARRSWAVYPAGDGAREIAFWLTKLGRQAEAIEYYADSFTVEDSRNTEADRAQDRARLGSLYTALHGSEKGLGDAILQAYDRTAGLMNARRALLKSKDPNALAVNLTDFALPAVENGAPPLVLSSLKGKTVVMDFWATWCVPCRAQQPLIEEVKKRFEHSPDVLFVPVDADDDPNLVAPFLKEQGWADKGYFEAGLARQFAIANIPTVMIVDPNGRISSRMIGFIPDRFEQMLTERVEEARHAPQTAPAPAK
ncbi:MAG: thioredoxin domain-containing protein [Acidobacteriota bacterium]|nr:thioredoxin domain-containing protein [Acidobacteriota bacterium]